MIRRPLHKRFGPAVLEGRKTTTIRDTAWPVGVPIMLYHWSGLPYRSPQINVAAVIVEATTPISIRRRDVMVFLPALIDGRPLWECEGFDSKADLDAWFAGKLKPGQQTQKHLMRFRLWGKGGQHGG